MLKNKTAIIFTTCHLQEGLTEKSLAHIKQSYNHDLIEAKVLICMVYGLITTNCEIQTQFTEQQSELYTHTLMRR